MNSATSGPPRRRSDAPALISKRSKDESAAQRRFRLLNAFSPHASDGSSEDEDSLIESKSPRRSPRDDDKDEAPNRRRGITFTLRQRNKEEKEIGKEKEKDKDKDKTKKSVTLGAQKEKDKPRALGIPHGQETKDGSSIPILRKKVSMDESTDDLSSSPMAKIRSRRKEKGKEEEEEKMKNGFDKIVKQEIRRKSVDWVVQNDSEEEDPLLSKG